MLTVTYNRLRTDSAEAYVRTIGAAIGRELLPPQLLIEVSIAPPAPTATDTDQIDEAVQDVVESTVDTIVEDVLDQDLINTIIDDVMTPDLTCCTD